MAALVEFVTRARSQSDRHQTNHVESLHGLSSNVHQTLASLGQSLDSTSTTLSCLGTEMSTKTSDLQASLKPFAESIRQPLTELQSNLQAAPLAEYVHTGETPQKRDWTYPTTLPRTEDHESMVARLRGLPDPKQQALTNAARTPGRSPRKMASPRKQNNSPCKLPSPSKVKIHTDVQIGAENAPIHAHPATTALGSGGGLKEIDMNVQATARPFSADGMVSEFSKSVGSGQQPPLKRHATAVEGSRLPMKLGGGRGRATEGRENVNVLSQSVGAGGNGNGSGRRLRSSPQQ